MEMICLDTNILIAHKRAKNKATTRLFELSTQFRFAVTVVTAFELYRGDNSNEDQFWSSFFSKITMLDFSVAAAFEAGRIYKQLRSKGSMIGMEDILIAAIAMVFGLRLATDNKSHLSRIEGLIII